MNERVGEKDGDPQWSSVLLQGTLAPTSEDEVHFQRFAKQSWTVQRYRCRLHEALDSESKKSKIKYDKLIDGGEIELSRGRAARPRRSCPRRERKGLSTASTSTSTSPTEDGGRDAKTNVVADSATLTPPRHCTIYRDGDAESKERKKFRTEMVGLGWEGGGSRHKKEAAASKLNALPEKMVKATRTVSKA
ncbi:hypothetical protein EVG20_g1608 [Dentipellis fragilis]|uniref:Uncharacterized protein n=1 Tax=Dentipellis fragilis TaxID=205917 RepID=A0A4Y9ZC44_9AGAM|nr:hypothetical protein EVG20_g1608 [Dentipellis fragilis]